MSLTLDDLRSRAGQLLYSELPEEYRFRDESPEQGDLGDLEAFLHGFGHLLDLIRETTEQAYADAFAEVADNGRRIQPWLLPYLAELVGVNLISPNPASRMKELNNAVGWAKAKGTLHNVNALADAIANTEVVPVEGWTRVVTTPRVGLPPFETSPDAVAEDGHAGNALPPLGTPDLRVRSRAVEDPSGANPTRKLILPGRDGDGLKIEPPNSVHWRPLNRRGVPCFPGAFDDVSVRTPDLRDPRFGRSGPHPSEVLLQVRPPDGLFEPGLRAADLGASDNPLQIDLQKGEAQVYGPAQVLTALGETLPNDPAKVPDKLVVNGTLRIHAGVSVELHDLLFNDGIRVLGVGDPPDTDDPTDTGPLPETRLVLQRCAAGALTLGSPGASPMVEAWDCLFDALFSQTGFAQLVHCTVLGTTRVNQLWASDCIFDDDLIDVTCANSESCIRYSRVPDLASLAGCNADKAPSNTEQKPRFARRWFQDSGQCVLRAPGYGEPGAGVLDLSTPPGIREGAEDEGEMGVGHHLHLCASLDALRRKLSDTLPHGQTASLRYDPRLLRPTPRAA